MSQDVKIEISSFQDEGEEKNNISSQTIGKLYNKKGTYYLKYEEDLEGLEGVQTTLKIKEDKLTLIRQGKVRVIQEFIPGKRTNFDYQTPYGTLKLELEVEKLNINLGVFKGEIDLSYRLYNQAGMISKNHLNITYKGE